MDESVLRDMIDSAIEDILENEPDRDADDIEVDEVLALVKDDLEDSDAEVDINLSDWTDEELADIVGEELTNF